jgi:hypothetical protein
VVVIIIIVVIIAAGPAVAAAAAAAVLLVAVAACAAGAVIAHVFIVTAAATAPRCCPAPFQLLQLHEALDDRVEFAPALRRLRQPPQLLALGAKARALTLPVACCVVCVRVLVRCWWGCVIMMVAGGAWHAPGSARSS